MTHFTLFFFFLLLFFLLPSYIQIFVRGNDNGNNNNKNKRPNFIVFQPDDLDFYEDWTPAPHIRPENALEFPANANLLRHMDRLRQKGLQMMQAYTTSPMCGTSRYSTITGRYPSRSSFGREINNNNNDISNVIIRTARLADNENVLDGNDCSDNNVAALLKKNGYHTGVVGKWHLWPFGSGQYTYETLVQSIQSCGFDYADAIYMENLGGRWNEDQTFSHNTEHVIDKAIQFIQETSTYTEEPFFLYVNPTAPQSGRTSHNVTQALVEFPCTATPSGTLEEEPTIVTMTDGNTTCAEYRQTIFDRAGTAHNNGADYNKALGTIWVDDGIGAILQTLEDNGKLDDTFFLFQMDHGQEAKGTLYEQGIRIAQFVYFPAAHFGLGGVDRSQFHGLVSTIDIAPTILDYAGIHNDSPGYYEMDGQSWRSAVEETLEEEDSTSSSWKDRCLFFELDFDRAIRCGCHKYLALNENTRRGTAEFGEEYNLPIGTEELYSLCNNEGHYEIFYNLETNETATEFWNNDDDDDNNNGRLLRNFQSLHKCHLERTLATVQPSYKCCDCRPSSATTSFACFSGQTTVQVSIIGMQESIIIMTIEEFLLQGYYDNDDDDYKNETKNKIMVSNDEDYGGKLVEVDYQHVFSFGHINFYAMATFLQIVTRTGTTTSLATTTNHTKNRQEVLEVTPEHLIYIIKHDDTSNSHGVVVPIRADHLCIGDHLLLATTTSNDDNNVNITRIQKQGIFSPLLIQGEFVAGGVRVSSYNAATPTMSHVTIGGMEVISHHALSHIAMAPFRALCLTSSPAPHFGSGSGSSMFHFCTNRNAEGQLLFAATGEQVVKRALIFMKNRFIYQALGFTLFAVTMFPARGLEVFILLSLRVDVVVFLCLVVVAAVLFASLLYGGKFFEGSRTDKF